MLFEPQNSGVPPYFPSMLADSARTRAYSVAIREMISNFQQKHNRAPIVLDLGAGTGVLTNMALQHGAAHVTAIEANKDLVQKMKTRFCNQKNAHIVRALSINATPNNLPFWGRYDAVVCELFGSTVTSENMLYYLQDLRSRGAIPARCPTVPRAATMTVCAYQISPSTSLPSRLARHQPWQKRRKLQWFALPKCAILKPIHAAPGTVVLHQRYDGSHPANEMPNFVAVRGPSFLCGRTVVLVLEWTADLWDGQVILDNQVQTVDAMPPKERSARLGHWERIAAIMADHFLADTAETSMYGLRLERGMRLCLNAYACRKPPPMAASICACAAPTCPEGSDCPPSGA